MDPISANNRPTLTPRTAPTEQNARPGETLNLRIESKVGDGAGAAYVGRNTDGRFFMLNARTTLGLAPGMELQIGQMLRVQVLSVKPHFQLGLMETPSAQATASPGSMAALQAQIQADVDTESRPDTQPLRLDQLLLQRSFHQGTGNDAQMLAEAWRGLVLARLRQVQNLPLAEQGRLRLDAATLALLQGQEYPLGSALAASLSGGMAASANPSPSLALPQFWMFHAYAWSNTLPLTFWLLRHQESSPGAQARTPTRSSTLRLRIEHPVHGPLWIDVRVDEMAVVLDLYAELGTAAQAADLAQQLRPTLSAALARAGLRLLRFHIQPGLPPRHADGGEDESGRIDGAGTSLPGLEQTSESGRALEQAQGSALRPFSSALSLPEAALAPELFLAAAEVLSVLRTA